ncbi:DEKNAAC102075 [Brettanomyces naardenensis]|uniref:phosphoinositide 5-phosphatase n=1 Tax=Brettanomyces naardenensis TaxID=13370 RepID=A0A448YJS9_BRENA|nr:DEKNAAC102075 [Brettanomyces naardenensis]
MRVFSNKSIHCLVIISNSFALIFRDSRTEKIDHHDSLPKLLIEFIPTSNLPPLEASGFVEIHLVSSPHNLGASPYQSSSVNTGLGDVPYYTQAHDRKLYGFLGLYSAKGSVYAGFITERSEVGSAVVNQRIYRIDNTIFISLKGECFDYYADDPHNDSTNTTSSSQNLSSSTPKSQINSVEKLLASGTFYYSPNFDMSSCIQERGVDFPSSTSLHRYSFNSRLYENSNNRFVWNGNMIQGLVTFRSRLSSQERLAFDNGRFLLTIVRGFAQSLTVKGLTPTSPSFLMTIISKQDCKKSGPLFGPYGMDDNGNATNFVETELIISDKSHCFAFLLLRGNVPLFWKLETQLMSTKVQFPRSDDASRHAFTRHFSNLVDKYGAIHVVDALSNKGSQPELSKRYSDYLTANLTENEPVLYSKIDASQCSSKKKGNAGLYVWGFMSYLEPSIRSNEAFCCDTNNTMMLQGGTFLVNTLDSNDRANFIEMTISEQIVTMLFKTLVDEDQPTVSWDDFWHNHKFLWDANGRSLGKLAESYNNSIRTKSKSGGIMGKMANQSKKYVSSASSSGKQTQFDKLLGRLQKQYQVELIDPIHDYVMEELNKRSNEFVSTKQLKVFTGTFNVNTEQYRGDIGEFIFPEPERFKTYDIVVIGLEEVVELSPGKIMNIDPKIRLFWEKKFKKSLAKMSGDDYVLLRGEQLGGILSLVFVKEQDNLKYIKEIETARKKTGLKGMAANKGGVAICFNYSKSTKFCFVTSHLAAGFSNVEERHQDFKTIANGLRFRQNRMLRDFDIVIWMGDFNFRINGSNETVRSALKVARKRPDKKQEILNQLFERDQLNKQMANGQSFPFFDEREITFMPTYKYDKGSLETFDSSEKMRIPAWTDRIVTLTRDKKLLQQELYNSVPSFQFSDHKPVYGVFNVDVDIVDETTKSEIEQGLYEMRKLEVGGVNSIISNDLTEGQSKVLRYGLPAPSNRDSKWWLVEEDSNGTEERRVKVRFKELESGEYVVNPKLPKNPFVSTTEADFVKKQD